MTKQAAAVFDESGANVSDHQTFVLPNGNLVLFSDHCFGGMVGETVEVIRAQLLVNPWSPPCEAQIMKRNMHYSELRELYRTEFRDYPKSVRLDFWRWTRALSPEAIRQRTDAEEAEVLAIVR